ncbi:MAG: prolipoprotein diacylglyceryl transferase, partial [Burkholderiales bacterium]
VSFPRFFNIAGTSINSYKVLLIVGLYAGSLTSAAVAARSGLSPLRVGLGAMTCAIAGLIGARLYYVLVNAREYLKARSWSVLWDSTRGGWSVFGALITFVPTAFGVARMVDLPIALFADHLGAGVLAGGFGVRLGCVFNGCCGGRETHGWFGVHLHDTHGVWKRRVPVQFMEMAWWLLGGILFLVVWPMAFPRGSYALGVLGWYGLGRFFLEPLREESDLVFGFVRIDWLVAGLVALGAGGAFVMRVWNL